MQKVVRSYNGDHDFDIGDSGASLHHPVQCTAVRKGDYVNIRNRPCKVVDVHSSKVGKHGHSKVNITGLDIFTDKRCQTVHPSSHNVDIPVVTKTDYILVDIGPFSISVLDDKGRLRSDLRAPDEPMIHTIQELMATRSDHTIVITVLSAMGEEQVIGVRSAKD
ncbi:unnamed protein product [Lymnaea stagnalis]|uniref:Eukaryotic translation initiation factor 5A n=1 Tax=Lymnaea stagnalis TaxID=6523 RepID=A0AAV2I350_LYMST